MDIFLILLLVIMLAALLAFTLQDKKRKTVISGKTKKAGTFKEIVQNTFPKYKVTEKNGQIIIFEINHRNEKDELVYIKLEQNKKEIRVSGRMLIAKYEKQPTPTEMRKDFININ